MIAAIPTTYRDIRFRSRLEARWAAFFDGLGAPWSYEPIDLPGWIPDFRIGDALVDVKPAREFDRETAEKIDRATRSLPTAERGAYVFAEAPTAIDQHRQSARRVGWVSTRGGDLVIAGVRGMGWAFFYSDPGSLFPALGFPGFYDVFLAMADAPIHLDQEAGAEIDRLWARACNATQWRAAR